MILHSPNVPVYDPRAPKILITWHRGDGLWKWLCGLFGHVPEMSNPACYECAVCGAIGYWHYEGHTENCYTKYSGGRCFCEPPRALLS